MKNSVQDHIRLSLSEDIYPQDITTQYLIPAQAKSTAYIIMKQPAKLCGLNMAKEVFALIDKSVVFTALKKDGDFVKKQTKIAKITGRTRSLLTGERVALNYLSHLSGIATYTSEFVKSVKPYRVDIYDTRKTTPGLRRLEKYAVTCGGAYNHRLNLAHMAMLKDNHKAALPSSLSLAEAVVLLKKKTQKTVIVEVNTLKELKSVLEAQPQVILLDNMSVAQLKKAVKLVKTLPKSKRPQLEASGGITLRNIKTVARAGVDRISIGALTHSAPAVDCSMEIIRQ